MMTGTTYVKKRGWQELSPQSDQPLFLGRLDMELTERCNNNCIHCYINLPAGDSKAQREELTLAEIQRILSEATSLGCLTVRFTGGEPLLRQDFAEIYRFARGLGLRVVLFTNATLITPALANLFASVPPLQKIEISVYGMTKQSYEAITQVPGSFKRFWAGVNLLLERKVPFVVKGLIQPENLDELEDFEAWAATLPGMSRRPSYVFRLDLRARRDSDERNEQIRSRRLLPPQEAEIFFSRLGKEYVSEMAQFCQRFMGPSGDQLFGCGAGFGGCVDAYGHYQPCLLLRHPDVVYDLRKGALQEALVHFFPQVRERRAQNRDYLVRCARCFLKGLCEQCPAKSWMEHGALDTPVAHLCETAHGEARLLGLLKEGEKAWEIADGQERIDLFTQLILSNPDRG